MKSDKERADFKGHLRRYMSIYLPDCPFEVNTTNRYTIVSHEAAVTARRFIKRNETIKYLSGVQVIITPEEEKEMTRRKKDFSIVVSARNKCASLFMGPARFANHDCNANAKLVTTGQAGIEIIANRNIEEGEEITVTYAENYFGVDNSECLCSTCERNQVNGWAAAEGETSVKKSIEEGSEEGYSLRRRRRADSVDHSSRTPSVTPDIRPRISKSRPRKSARESLANDSAANDSPMPPPSASKKRPSPSNIITPPFTPAKKLKLSQTRALPLVLDMQSSRSSSSQSQRSDSVGSANGSSTDITEPEKESPGPDLYSPKPKQIPQSISVLKQEDSETGAGDVLSNTWPFGRPTTAQSATQSHSVPEAPVHMDTAPSRSNITMSIESICNPLSPPSSQQTVASEDEALTTVEPVTDPAPVILRVDPTETTEEHTEPKQKRKYTKRTFIKETTPPARQRQPGDYTLTPLLLAEPEMAWIRCMNCDTAFVQHNAYYTKSSCPRCERHSKLYGFIWPKTQRQGPRDKEERILDHRTIHRYLNNDDEAKIRGRKRRLADDEGTETPSEAPASKRRRGGDGEETALDDAGSVRRSGRARRVSSRVAAS